MFSLSQYPANYCLLYREMCIFVVYIDRNRNKIYVIYKVLSLSHIICELINDIAKAEFNYLSLVFIMS